MAPHHAATRECCAETADQNHLVKIVAYNTDFHLSVSGRAEHDHFPEPSVCHVTEPAASVRHPFRGPHDVFDLHVPNILILECARDTPRQAPALSTEPTRDPVREGLGEGGQVHSSPGDIYAGCASIAIVARLLASTRRAIPSERPHADERPRWQLKKAVDYADSHLAESVSLAALASGNRATARANQSGWASGMESKVKQTGPTA
jgi:hypothetical protein